MPTLVRSEMRMEEDKSTRMDLDERKLFDDFPEDLSIEFESK